MTKRRTKTVAAASAIGNATLLLDPAPNSDTVVRDNPFANYKPDLEQEALHDAWIHLCDWITLIGKIEHEAAVSEDPKADSGGKTNTRGSVDDKSEFHPSGAERLEGKLQVVTSTVTAVRWHWNKSLGPDGYDLFTGHSWTHFPGPEWRLEEVINPPIRSESERRDVNWTITWNRPGGRPSLIDLKEIDVVSKTADPSVLNDVLDRKAGEPPADEAKPEKPTYKGHTAVPDEAIHAIPNHIKRELALADGEFGKHVRACYGGSVVDYQAKHGVEKAWDTALDYVERLRERAEVTLPDAQDEARKLEQAKTAPNKPAGEAIAKTEPTPQSETNGPSLAPETRSESASVSAVEKATNIIPFPRLPTTLTGISVLEISRRLDVHLPPQAYKAIEYGQMKNKTDLDGDYVRDRFDQVFGPMGIGWRIMPHATAGKVECRAEVRTKTDQKTGEVKDQTWHIVTLVAHTFQYTVIMPDGSFQWVDASTTSDQHDNMDEQYAYRGAMTSLMKQFYRLMGGMNHIVYNQYTHVHAQKELNRKSA